MRSGPLVALVCLLLSAGNIHAQWTGSLSTDGAYNFKQSNRENLSFNLKYNAEKFYVGTELGGAHNYLPTSEITEILDSKQEGGAYYKSEDKELCPRNWNIRGAVLFGYRFNERNTLDYTLNCVYKRKMDFPMLSTFRFAGQGKDTLEGEQLDSTANSSLAFDSRLQYIHKLASRPDAAFSITASGFESFAIEENTRITTGNFYSRNKYYRTGSSINDLDSKLNAAYGDLFRFKTSELKLDSGIDLSFANDIDLYGAETYVGGHWRDSTQYQQSYFYYAFTMEPYVHLKYSFGKLDISVKERVQFYNHCIMDKLDIKTGKDDSDYLFDIYDWKNLLGAGLAYRINDLHSLKFDYARSIVRPDYKKLCPTLMIGKSEGEYYIGNPELQPEITDKLGLEYTYRHRIFVTSLSFSFTDKENTAEKALETSVMQDALDPMVKTLYTWVNTKSQQSFSTRLNMLMNASDVVAQIWAAYNYDIYRTRADITKKDSNYELGTSVTASLNETVKLSAKLVYISAKASAFNSKGENVLANLRISKSFRNGLELYLEGQDLVDKDKYEETWDEALTYYKCITTKPMNRAVVLGLKYSF